MPPPSRVILAGYGLAGEFFHAPFIAAEPGLELTTVVTRDPDRAARARAAHPGVRIAADAQAAMPGHDLLVVAAANRAHHPLAAAGLGAGLHVVVDKPLAVTAAEAAELQELARWRERLLIPFHNRRWDAEFLTLRRLLGDGTLGDPVRIESRFCRWRPDPRPASWRESADPADGGGLLLDLGSHLVDQCVALLGAPMSVYAEVDRRRPGAGPDDDVFIALGHHGGVRAHLWASAFAADAGPRLRVLGTRAAYVNPFLDGQEDALRAGARPGDGAPWGVEPESRWGEVVAGDARTPVPSEPGAWPAFYAGVAAAVRDGAPPPVDAADAVTVLRVLEAARTSAAQSAIVRL
ncbi:MAG: Gfo/Idh/MocA family oxidoreductase [Thermoleophilia bacterium]|nr:Gfo/Idh/MocA family oxidoreductase [Thermoleophilia bacterium]